MLPAEFGGPDDPRNVTYLPTQLAERKRAFDAEIRRRLEAGEELSYRVTPEYDNDRFVPARLHLEAAAAGGGTACKELIEVARDLIGGNAPG
jgi:hypothetical protein